MVLRVKMERKVKTLSVPDELYNEAVSYCRANEITFSAMVCFCLHAFLHPGKSKEKAKDFEKRLDNVRKL
jgi:hypothetical protein